MRTNLASLILRLAELGFTDIDAFPLLDRPKPAAVRAGLETLQDLGLRHLWTIFCVVVWIWIFFFTCCLILILVGWIRPSN